MPGMTAAEAIHAIRECAYYAGMDVDSPALVEEAGCAEERVRLAFAVLEAIEEELATPYGGGEHYPVLHSLLDTARARLEAK